MRRLTREEFIERSNVIHCDIYDYSKVEYINSRTKVIITCHVHGDFKMTPTNHCNAQKQGCPKCGKLAMSKTQSKEAKLKFQSRVEKIHPDMFLFDKCDYITSKTKVKLYCKACKDYFYIMPYNLYSGSGCLKCARKHGAAKISNRCGKTIIKRIEKIHPNKFNFDRLIYTNATEKIEVGCKKCGNYFRATSNSLLYGSGCPSCAVYGFDPMKPAILYYIKIGEQYKIGITNKSLKERYSVIYDKIEIINLWYYSNGREAHEAEQRFIKKYKEFKFNGVNPIYGSKSKEMFTKEVLNLYPETEDY